MKTVKEVSNLTGISVRTLHHYDAIGLLKPAQVTDSGYRLYDDATLEQLYMILIFRGFRSGKSQTFSTPLTMTETGFWKNKLN